MIRKKDIIEGLEEVWAAWENFGSELSEEEWLTSSRCPGWTVKDNLSHIAGTENMLAGNPAPENSPVGDHIRNPIGTANEHWVESFRNYSGAEVLEAFKEITSERIEVLRNLEEEQFTKVGWTPAGEAPYGRFMQIRIYDSWLHLQDCREPLGKPGDEDGKSAEISVQEVVEAIGYIVGKRGKAPEGSCIEICLTGPIERTLNVQVEEKAQLVDHFEGEPTVSLTLTSTDFLALTGGRNSAAQYVEDGRLVIEGDQEVGKQISENLAFTV